MHPPNDDAHGLIYLIDASGHGVKFRAVGRSVKSGDGKLSQMVQALLRGPALTEDDLRTDIPAGTRLLKVFEISREIVLSISNQFVIGGGLHSMLVD